MVPCLDTEIPVEFSLIQTSPIMDEAADIRHSGVVKARHDISSTNQLDGDHLEPIAVVGFSMRFPQEATSPEAFWEILCKGKSAMTEVPPDRFNINGFYHPNASRPDTVCSPIGIIGESTDSLLYSDKLSWGSLPQR